VREAFVEGAGAKLVVVGADFHFGRGRGGNVALLERMGAELGFAVVGLGLEAAPGGVVYSSTRIRELLQAGDVGGAAALLGRPHEVRGRVKVGDRRGRELGFPTANLMVPSRVCLPADGIYAGTFVAEDAVERAAAISLGRRPTFYEHAEMSLLEAFVLDFEGDLYDQDVKVRFKARLRGEERFDSAELLVEQMKRDVEETRRLLVRPGARPSAKAEWYCLLLVIRRMAGSRFGPPGSRIAREATRKSFEKSQVLPFMPDTAATIAEHRLHETDTGS